MPAQWAAPQSKQFDRNIGMMIRVSVHLRDNLRHAHHKVHQLRKPRAEALVSSLGSRFASRLLSLTPTFPAGISYAICVCIRSYIPFVNWLHPTVSRDLTAALPKETTLAPFEVL